MLKAKPKLCYGCNLTKPIWKRSGGQKYCKDCWNSSLDKTFKPTKKKPLSPRSSKKEKLDVVYSILRKNYLSNHPMCEARFEVCSFDASDIHHKKGRVGDLYLNDTEFMSVCRECHRYIHDNPKLAKELGYYH